MCITSNQKGQRWIWDEECNVPPWIKLQSYSYMQMQCGVNDVGFGLGPWSATDSLERRANEMKWWCQEWPCVYYLVPCLRLRHACWWGTWVVCPFPWFDLGLRFPKKIHIATTFSLFCFFNKSCNLCIGPGTSHFSNAIFKQGLNGMNIFNMRLLSTQTICLWTN